MYLVSLLLVCALSTCQPIHKNSVSATGPRAHVSWWTSQNLIFKPLLLWYSKLWTQWAHTLPQGIVRVWTRMSIGNWYCWNARGGIAPAVRHLLHWEEFTVLNSLRHVYVLCVMCGGAGDRVTSNMTLLSLSISSQCWTCLWNLIVHEIVLVKATNGSLGWRWSSTGKNYQLRALDCFELNGLFIF